MTEGSSSSTPGETAMTSIAMLDLQAEFKLFEDEIRAAIDGVLKSQYFINGPEVAAFEEALSERIGVGHAIALNTGSDALLCALMALGIGPGDEVIVPAFTFVATAGAVARAGATPVFVDVDPHTFNIDPAKVAAAVTSRTRAVIPVHLFGQCAEMDELQALASKHEFALIEDAAQAIGAAYKGRPACTLGTAACLSFYPTKNLGGLGEGGAILTDDGALAQIVRQLRNHGESQRYVCERVGANFRLDTMKAATLLVKMKHLDHFTEKRREHAGRYDELLADGPVTTPVVAGDQYHVYNQYSILCDRRDELKAYLADGGIQSAIYYPVGLHLQPCFASLGHARGDLPVCEELCDRVLSLPCHPMLSDEDVTQVTERIESFYEPSPAVKRHQVSRET